MGGDQKPTLFNWVTFIASSAAFAYLMYLGLKMVGFNGDGRWVLCGAGISSVIYAKQCHAKVLGEQGSFQEPGEPNKKTLVTTQQDTPATTNKNLAAKLGFGSLFFLYSLYLAR